MTALGADAAGVGNVAPYMAPVMPDSVAGRSVLRVAIDPFDPARRESFDEPGVAPDRASGTVSRTPVAGPRLTAILIADERRIAVIDEATVKVGDVLRDGARVASIQADRVWVSDKDGRMRMLTLNVGGR